MDGDTIEYQDTLRREIEYRYPLLSEVLDISDPRAGTHLCWNPVTKIKYEHLRDVATGIRIVRPDGNCFYRAYAMRLIELTKESAEFKQLLKDRARTAMNTSIAQVFRGLSVEEFYEAFMETIDADTEVINLDLSTDLYIITFMRCLTSAYLQTHESDFSPFLADGTYSSIADFCRKEVDPMYRESDQLQITALTLQLGVPVEVHYLDRSEGDTANVIRLPADDFGTHSNFQVSLVYKPGHYDILYT